MAMRLQLYRSLWGVIMEAPTAEGRMDYRSALHAIKEMGYSGVEVPLLWGYQAGGHRIAGQPLLSSSPTSEAAANAAASEFTSVLRHLNLELIPMLLTSGPVTPAAGGVPGHPVPENTSAARVKSNLDVFKAQVSEVFGGKWDCGRVGAGGRCAPPRFANAHSISDFFHWQEAEEFFNAALQWQEEQGVE